jgi:hypothetical protein
LTARGRARGADASTEMGPLARDVQGQRRSATSPPVATIRDVAKHSGASTASVSRVVAGNCPVSEALRVRITASIAELGYSPDKTAQALGRTKSPTLRIVSFLGDVEGGPALHSFMRIFGKAGYAISAEVASGSGADLAAFGESPVSRRNTSTVLIVQRSPAVRDQLALHDDTVVLKFEEFEHPQDAATEALSIFERLGRHIRFVALEFRPITLEKSA